MIRQVKTTQKISEVFKRHLVESVSSHIHSLIVVLMQWIWTHIMRLSESSLLVSTMIQGSNHLLDLNHLMMLTFQRPWIIEMSLRQLSVSIRLLRKPRVEKHSQKMSNRMANQDKEIWETHKIQLYYYHRSSQCSQWNLHSPTMMLRALTKVKQLGCHLQSQKKRLKVKQLILKEMKRRSWKMSTSIIRERSSNEKTKMNKLSRIKKPDHKNLSSNYQQAALIECQISKVKSGFYILVQLM